MNNINIEPLFEILINDETDDNVKLLLFLKLFGNICVNMYTCFKNIARIKYPLLAAQK